MATETARAIFAGVRARDPRAIARALSAAADATAVGAELATLVTPHAAHGLVIGITGPPGAGKSTIVERLIAAYRQDGRTVGVIAVDPSSPFTGGAILGDRVRMQAHADDAGVYIRSLATRGERGGLARGAAVAVATLQAAGFDVVLVETVGVGQDEVDVAAATDVRVVVLVPESGDDMQALKAGLMEIGDIVALNKSDRPGADRAAASIEQAFGLGGMPAADEWTPPVLRLTATEGHGIAELIATIGRFCQAQEQTVANRRRERTAQLTTAARRRVTGAALDHVGVAVQDPSPVLTFLRDAFGIEAEPPVDVPGQRVRVTFARLGREAVEVIEATDSSSPVSAFLSRRGPGLHHVAVRVPDLDGTLAALRSRGVRLVDETPRLGAEGRRIAFVHPSASGGVLVELIEAPVKEDDTRAFR